MEEHKKDIETAKIALHVYQHVDSFDHTFDFENVKILDSSNNPDVRLHLESLHTYMQTGSINKSIYLNNTYKKFLPRK